MLWKLYSKELVLSKRNKKFESKRELNIKGKRNKAKEKDTVSEGSYWGWGRIKRKTEIVTD